MRVAPCWGLEAARPMTHWRRVHRRSHPCAHRNRACPGMSWHAVVRLGTQQHRHIIFFCLPSRTLLNAPSERLFAEPSPSRGIIETSGFFSGASRSIGFWAACLCAPDTCREYAWSHCGRMQAASMHVLIARQRLQILVFAGIIQTTGFSSGKDHSFGGRALMCGGLQGNP